MSTFFSMLQIIFTIVFGILVVALFLIELGDLICKKVSSKDDNEEVPQEWDKSSSI